MLALVHSVPCDADFVPDYACSACGVYDSDGTSSPRILDGDIGSYVERVEWLCAACARAVWGAYKRARAARVWLAECSRLGGWAMTRAQAREWERRQAGVQLGLWGGV